MLELDVSGDCRLQAPGQHFSHHFVVVGPALGEAKAEPAVFALLRPAILEDDHRPDCLGSRDVRDVEGLDAARWYWQR